MDRALLFDNWLRASELDGGLYSIPVSYTHLVQGLDYPGKRAFSLQFHPEAHGGPLDCGGMLDVYKRQPTAYSICGFAARMASTSA